MVSAGTNRIGALFAFGVLIWTTSVWAQPNSPIDFGGQVQPIFAKRCLACHGPDKAEGGLRLDQRESAFAKQDSGATAIVAKDVSKSELIRRITAEDESERMPPEGAPLSADQIQLLKKWVESGAEWKEHWAFESPTPQTPPAVKDSQWVINPIDAFVLHKLEQNSLSPAPRLQNEALIRRLTYDLTGLPPTQAEITAFLADQSPNAYERLVDRLLQSPHFGEQWARHWLDVVRYADTNSFERDGAKPHAWRYRDYVIRSLNDDKPYDRFIREQLAGDELPDGGNDGLIATGFYRLGLWDDEPADKPLAIYDVLDDIITTTSQGFLGLTVNCARCHDHKIDPIPQRDYYSMLAFFKGITPNGYSNPNVERPIFRDDAAKEAYEVAVNEHREQLNGVQTAVTAIEKEFRQHLDDKDRQTNLPDLDELEYAFYRDTWQQLPDFDSLKPETVAKLDKGLLDISPATREFAFGFVFKGVLKVPADGEYVFVLDSDDGSRLSVNGQQVVTYDGIHGLGQPKVGKITLKQGRVPVRVDYFQGEAGAKGLVVKWSGPGVDQRLLSTATPDGKPTGGAAPIRKKDFAALIGSQGPTLLGQQKYDQYVTLTRQLDELKKKKVEADFAMCVTETGAKPPETHVLKRGNPQAHGDVVVPAYLATLGGGVATIPDQPTDAKTSGRRTALANWIASPDNRLTARVLVNRLWQHHFGRGIVRSPNNFGLLGDRPTHPELLDWLAIELMKGEPASTGSSTYNSAPWSMKRIHKLIVMSNTYRMSSRSEAQSVAGAKDPRLSDPLNNLFWRHDLRRLSAEELRDSILATTGQLNPKMYGRGVFPKISDEVKAGQSIPGQGWENSPPEEQVRRSVYVFVKRSLLLPILSDFDFADTDSSCAARFTTTQPTQALGMLNGEFLNEQAIHFAARLRREAGDDVKKQVELAYRLALCREPDQTMIGQGLTLIESMKTKHRLSADKALEQFCLMTLNLNEFVYLD